MRFYTTVEVAAQIGVTPRAVEYAAKTLNLPKFNRTYLISPDDLVALKEKIKTANGGYQRITPEQTNRILQIIRTTDQTIEAIAELVGVGIGHVKRAAKKYGINLRERRKTLTKGPGFSSGRNFWYNK